MIETNRPKCNADNIRTGVPAHTYTYMKVHIRIQVMKPLGVRASVPGQWLRSKHGRGEQRRFANISVREIVDR